MDAFRKELAALLEKHNAEIEPVFRYNDGVTTIGTRLIITDAFSETKTFIENNLNAHSLK